MGVLYMEIFWVCLVDEYGMEVLIINFIVVYCIVWLEEDENEVKVIINLFEFFDDEVMCLKRLIKNGF